MNRQDAKDAKDAKIQEPGDEIDRHAHAVIGAAIEVHRWLGPGFLEGVYEEALWVELELRGIPFMRQAPVAIRCKGRRIGDSRIDVSALRCGIRRVALTDEPWRPWRPGGSSSRSE